MLFNDENVLIPANKLAEYKQQLIDLRRENDQYVQLVAHDMKAPIRKLGTFIERLIAKSKLTAEPGATRYIEKIEKTLEDIQIMLDSMSAYADLDANPLDTTSVDLDMLINDCIIKTRKHGGGTEMQVDFSKLPTIMANRNEVKILFTELFTNAIKFKSGIAALRITITTNILSSEEKEIFNLAAGKTYHRIIFCDNGIGFSKECNQKIFQPFYRLHGKSTYPGYGLGLAICRKIMSKHEGLIYADAGEERGASFTIIFPETS